MSISCGHVKLAGIRGGPGGCLRCGAVGECLRAMEDVGEPAGRGGENGGHEEGGFFCVAQGEPATHPQCRCPFRSRDRNWVVFPKSDSDDVRVAPRLAALSRFGAPFEDSPSYLSAHRTPGPSHFLKDPKVESSTRMPWLDAGASVAPRMPPLFARSLRDPSQRTALARTVCE